MYVTVGYQRRTVDLCWRGEGNGITKVGFYCFRENLKKNGEKQEKARRYEKMRKKREARSMETSSISPPLENSRMSSCLRRD
jgi:hypothetical protein